MNTEAVLADDGTHAEPAESDSAAPRLITLAEHDAAVARFRAGALSLSEYRAAFEATVASRHALAAELSSLTKEQLGQRIGGFPRWRTDPKSAVVNSALYETVCDFSMESMLHMDYNAGGDTYTVHARAVSKAVNAATPERLAAYAQRIAERHAAHAAQGQAMLEALTNPQTVGDFEHFIRCRGGAALTPEQRERYDALRALDDLARMKAHRAKREAERATVSSTGQLVGAQIIETTHTQKLHALFVVQLAERVPREIYDRFNVAAKKLGGYYSSYRFNGAVPGFQFRERAHAEAFQALAAEGDTERASALAKERRDVYQDDKGQATTERLRAMADRLEESATESRDADRKVNTARRAGIASRMEARASSEIAQARTMRNIADAIDADACQFLADMRSRSQLETLNALLREAQREEVRALYPCGIDRERHSDEAPTLATVNFAKLPTYRAYRSSLAQIGRGLADVPGAKQLSAAILKISDDLSKDYCKFARENLGKVLLRVNGGELAIFKSRETALNVVRRSPGGKRFAVVSLKRGEHVAVLSPQEAIARKLWEGPADEYIGVTPDTAVEIIEKASAARVEYPYFFDAVKQHRARLHAMGLQTSSMLRAALRELVQLRTAPPAVDKVKQLMRDLVGVAGIGVDFFPTPEATADDMVARACIEAGHRVMEPEAGYGAIADAIRGAGVEPDVCELSHRLREILSAKGYTVVAFDFMEYHEGGYDRIVMNPPFSNGADIDHVRHAFDLLKPGGRLVAIMSEGSFFRQDKKAEAFRAWADDLGASDERLPPGTFLDSSLPATTGAHARIVVIDKPKEG